MPSEAAQRAKVAAAPRRGPLFRAGLPVAGLTAGHADTDSPPTRLIAIALLALVLAGASFLTLTARLSREWRV